MGLQAAAGGFTALYAAALAPRERAKVVPIVALGMLGCAALGVLLAPWTWAFIVGLALLAPAVSALAFAYRLGAPGPVFFVLMYGLSGSVTAVDAGVRRAEPLLYLGVLAVACAFAVLVAISPLVLTRHRRAQPRPLRDLLPGPWLGAGERWLLARIALVAMIGSLVSGLWLDPEHAYWTVATGVAVIGLATARSASLTRAVHRTVGTVVGVALFFAVAPLGEVPALLVLLLTGLQFAIEFTVARNYALALAFVTPLVLFLNGAATGLGPAPAVAIERVVDTVLGALLAVATAALGWGRPTGDRVGPPQR